MMTPRSHNENQLLIFSANGVHPVDWPKPCTNENTPKIRTIDESPNANPVKLTIIIQKEQLSVFQPCFSTYSTQIVRLHRPLNIAHQSIPFVQNSSWCRDVLQELFWQRKMMISSGKILDSRAKWYRKSGNAYIHTFYFSGEVDSFLSFFRDPKLDPQSALPSDCCSAWTLAHLAIWISANWLR